MMFKAVPVALLMLTVVVGEVAISAEETVSASHGSLVNVEGQTHFAVIAGERIPPEDYVAALRKAVRERYFHGRVKRDEMEKFRHDIAEQLVSDILMEREARRRKLKIDADVVSKRLDEVDKSLSQYEEWPSRRDTMLALFRRTFEREMYIEALKTEIEKVSEPDAATLKAFYEANKDKFTTPEKLDVSIIMLSVDPSSPSDVWQAAVKEGEDLVSRIRKGAKFEDLARIHSSDESAVRGGHMGFLHLGMLATPAQSILAIMKKGDVSEPVMLLQGVGIFRLNDRKPEELNPLSKVRERASSLWQREQGDKRWVELRDKLRKSTPVEINDVLVRLTAEESTENGQR